MSEVSTIWQDSVRRKRFQMPEESFQYDWQMIDDEENFIPKAVSHKLTIIVDVDSTYDVLEDQSGIFDSSSDPKSKYGAVVITPYGGVQSDSVIQALYYRAGTVGNVTPQAIRSHDWWEDFILPELNVFELEDRSLDGVIKDIKVDEVRHELSEFRQGIEGVQPARQVVKMAVRISKVAINFTKLPDITVDIDGELSFYLRLKDGRLVLAELGVEGLIDASVYDENDKLLKRMPSATEKELIAVLKS